MTRHSKSHFHFPNYSTERHSYCSPVQLVPISLASRGLQITSVFSHSSCRQEPNDLQQDDQENAQRNLVKCDYANVTLVTTDTSWNTQSSTRKQRGSRSFQMSHTLANQETFARPNRELYRTLSGNCLCFIRSYLTGWTELIPVVSAYSCSLQSSLNSVRIWLD